ncbi:MAG: HNH endonuclease [Deltaproteobacteria bacterium]|nr:HNH endonuclease [Deltaproteobacteria bacterium]
MSEIDEKKRALEFYRNKRLASMRLSLRKKKKRRTVTPEEEKKFIKEYEERLDEYIKSVSDNWKNMGRIFLNRRKVVAEARKEYRKSGFTKHLKDTILKRDNHACKECDSIEKPLHVHHLNLDKSNNDPSNLVTLCAKCHGSIDHNLGESPLKNIPLPPSSRKSRRIRYKK